jgi:hypothetical protein
MGGDRRVARQPPSRRQQHPFPPCWGVTWSRHCQPARSELHRQAPAVHLSSSVTAMNAASLGGCRAGAQIRPHSSSTISSTRRSSASLRPSIAAVAQDRAIPSLSSCVHLNLPVNGHTLAYIHAQVQARLAKRSPMFVGHDVPSSSEQTRKKLGWHAKTIAQCSGSRVADCAVVDILDARRS